MAYERSRPNDPRGLVWAGIAVAIRRWPLALALYLPGLVLALLATLPAFSAAESLARLGPWTQKLAEGDLLNTFLELAGRTATETATTEAGTAMRGFLLSLGLVLLFLPLQGLLYNLLVGGVLARLVGRSELGFWAACRRWFWPMFAYGLVSFVFFVVVAVGGLVLVALLPLPWSVVWWLEPIIFGAWLAVWNGVVECGRANMVARDDRGVFSALGRALRVLGRTDLLPLALVVWLVLGLVGVAYTALGTNLVFAVPVGLPLLLLPLQQVVAFLGALLKVVRLGAAVGLARAAGAEAP